MVIIIFIIAKVMIMKSMIIKMIMMFTMAITVWLNTERSNYSTYICGGFLDFCHHFYTFFEIYILTVHEIYCEKFFLAAILSQGFCQSEKDKYWWMVVAFEWTVSSFLNLFTICSLWSLLKILMVNHNGVFLVQNIWLGNGKFLLLCSLSWKLWDLCQAKLMLWSFFNLSWLEIWTFWLLVTLCSMLRGLQHNCKVNGSV